MGTTEDPYFSGDVKVKAAKSGPRLAGRRPPLMAWTIVFAANLIVPLYFGLEVTRVAGRAGMALGILFVYGSGYGLCLRYRWAMLTVVYGGWAVALLQVVPILQIVAGAVALSAVGAMNPTAGRGPGNGIGEPGALLATLITGGILLAVASLFGLVFRWLGTGLSHTRAARADVVAAQS